MPAPTNLTPIPPSTQPGFCSTPPPETKFEWGEDRGNIEKSLASVRDYETVARCSRPDSRLKEGWTIYIDAPWFNNEILGNHNRSNELKVTDVGGSPVALCNEPEGIDVYFGHGLSAFKAWLEFKKLDSVQDTPYWPVYRIIE